MRTRLLTQTPIPTLGWFGLDRNMNIEPNVFGNVAQWVSALGTLGGFGTLKLSEFDSRI